MTNKEFVDYCKAGNIDKVKEGIADKKVNHAAWKSRALQYALDGLIHTKTGKANSPYSIIMDLLIQNTNVDPSTDVFISIWAVKYCEFETIKLAFNHPNNINNTNLFNHSFQIIENAFLIDRLDIAEFLLNLTNLDKQKALAGFIEWGRLPKMIDKIKLIMKFGGNIQKLELYVLDILFGHIVLYDDLDFFNTLMEIEKFDPSVKNNKHVLSAETQAPRIFEILRNDYRVQEKAILLDQTTLINKNIVDIFVF